MKASQTAQLGAAHRAYHYRHVRPLLHADSEASWLLGPPLSVILKYSPLRRFFFERLLARVRPISTFVVVRSAYAESRFQQLITEGYQQYLILGAGLDSWALRNQVPGVHVYELDHPATQEWKKSRILFRLGEIPPHLSLVPIDFESATITEVLNDTQFVSDAPSFVSWLGTSYYLTPKAIKTTLESLAMVCAPGSRIVFDYFVPKSMMSSVDLDLFEDLEQGGKRRGESMKTLMATNEILEVLHTTGFRLVEDLSASEITNRYLSGRSDGLTLPGFARLCCAEIAAQVK